MQQFAILFDTFAYVTTDKEAVKARIADGFKAYAIDYYLQVSRAPETMKPVGLIEYGKDTLLSY